MLYQEVRPKTFSDVVGNTSTVKSLQSLCKRSSSDRPHTILLSGSKGCGKTTIGRILASEFKTKPENTFEIDTAVDRGIDGIRAITENIQYKPMGGGSVTYIIDEVHRLTRDAQSALLKSTEDTPEHVYFILCTTDPQKLLPTLKNRCSSYTVEQLKSKHIVSILKRACKIKNINISPEVLDIISTSCDRTPRTALVLLEKIQDLTDLDEIADVLVSEIDSSERGDFFNLCKQLLVIPEKRRTNWKNILVEFTRLEEDPEKVRNGLLTFMRKQLLKIDAADVEYATDVSRTIQILSQNTFYGGENLLVSMLMEICLGGIK